MSDFRVVVDTNVLVSGLFGIKNSPSSQILKAIRTQQIVLVTSPIILEEVKDVISRERIVELIKMSTDERTDFIDKLIERGDITPGKQLLQLAGRDEKDDKFLVCAVEGSVDFVITGDEDLLVLKQFEGIKIVSPREFMGILRTEN